MVYEWIERLEELIIELEQATEREEIEGEEAIHNLRLGLEELKELE